MHRGILCASAGKLQRPGSSTQASTTTSTSVSAYSHLNVQPDAE